MTDELFPNLASEAAKNPQTDEIIQSEWTISAPDAAPRLTSVKRVTKPKSEKKRSRQAEYQARRIAADKELGRTPRQIATTDEEQSEINALLKELRNPDNAITELPLDAEPVATTPDPALEAEINALRAELAELRDRAPATLDDVLSGSDLASWRKSLIRWLGRVKMD